MFDLQAQDPLTNARTGILRTAHGAVATPFFMPVATKATAKCISPQELVENGAEAIILNAYLLHAMPGSERISQLGGIHQFMAFPNTIIADSGGFQMIRESLFLGISDKGVQFRNPFTKQKEMVSPEDIMRIDMRLGVDGAMCLDHMPFVLDPYEDIFTATLRTHKWAQRCKLEHDRLKKEGNVLNDQQLLFGIAQGGTHQALREKSAKFINSLGFDGHAFGGLCIGERREEMYSAVVTQLPHFDAGKPRYLMGVGSPEDILECISYGVDCFDSVYPTQTARRGTMFTLDGQIDITKSKYQEDTSPIDESCQCATCKAFTRAYLHHVAKVEKYTAYRYLSVHNTHFIQQLMKEIRKGIDGGYFSEFKGEFLERYAKGKREKR
ncbi:tRNA guanosine(34) transglycosylase Tgt [Candidatus Woesearchaeota archaeon]|nr:tRNA guanosine(34) transglycosylase Tgt [Candidatus Woesearchaeota archaeon]